MATERRAEFISGYEYKTEGTSKVFDQDDVIHFRDGIDPMNMRMGLSPVASVMREVYTDQEIANYSALLMKNGAVPPVVISLKENVNAYQFDPNDVREKYLQTNAGRSARQGVGEWRGGECREGRLQPE